ncbi:MAG: hypothetical protein NTX50_00520 [Candidatus Sumerlaeota bacterium]|nr:hypothetical protein [Candidatus Sumerlaeota bacterium]
MLRNGPGSQLDARRGPVTVLCQVKRRRIRLFLHLLGGAISFKQIHYFDSGGAKVFDQFSGLRTDDDVCIRNALRYLVRINALLVGRRNHQQAYAALRELVAEMGNGGQRVAIGGRFWRPLRQIAETRFIEEPAIAANKRFVARILQECELRKLNERPQLPGNHTGVFHLMLIGAEVFGRGFLLKHVQRLRRFAAPKLSDSLDDARRADDSQEADHEKYFWMSGFCHGDQNWK